MEKTKFDKIFMNVLNEETGYVNNYSVGDGVKFTTMDVAPYNQGKEIGFDYGKIVKKVGSDYMVELDNGVVIKVMNQHAYAFGNADATPE